MACAPKEADGGKRVLQQSSHPLAPSISKQLRSQISLTIDLLSVDIYAPGHKFRPTDSKVAGSANLNSAPGSGPGTENEKVPVFWDRKAITLRSGVLEQNYLHIRILRTRNPNPHISWHLRVFLGRFTEPNRFPAGTTARPGPKL